MIEIREVPLPLTRNPPSTNNGEGVLDADGSWYENPSAALGALLGLCECASDGIAERAAQILKRGDANLESHDDEERELFEETLCHMMGTYGLIAHGTNVRNVYLLDLGKAWVQALSVEHINGGMEWE